ATRGVSLKTSIYLPDDLAKQVRAHGIPISEVTQTALRRAVHAATIRENVVTDIQAVAERLRGTIDQSELDSRDRGRRDGISWAKDHATAGELAQVANLHDSVLEVARPHTLLSFVSATGDTLHHHVKID